MFHKIALFFIFLYPSFEKTETGDYLFPINLLREDYFFKPDKEEYDSYKKDGGSVSILMLAALFLLSLFLWLYITFKFRETEIQNARKI
jgi:hypothetical protein